MIILAVKCKIYSLILNGMGHVGLVNQVSVKTMYSLAQ